MFGLRMVLRSLSKQFAKRSLIALTVALCATICVAMLGIVFDVGDKLNAELTTYGSNITVQPRADSVIDELYGTASGADAMSGSASSASDATHSQHSAANAADSSMHRRSETGGLTSIGDSEPTAADSAADGSNLLKESDAAKIKTIFWAYNITNFAPELNIHAQVALGKRDCMAKGSGCVSVPVMGTWFAKKLSLPTGETTVAGIQGMRSWWSIEGAWPKDQAQEALVGKDIAQALGLHVGSRMTMHKMAAGDHHSELVVTVAGIYDSHDGAAQQVIIPTGIAQELANLPDSVDRIEVKALTTPENDLARRAAKNPAALSREDWETWYCTAYPSSIAYQIEEVIPGAVAKQVRQVSALQGEVLQKTRTVMIVMTVLSLIAAAIAIANLMASSLAQRARELALLKAIGATDGAVIRLMLAETGIIAAVGAVIGALAGSGAAQLVGQVVFGSGITMRPMVFVLVAVLLTLTVLIASISSIRAIVRVQPAQVLHGR